MSQIRALNCNITPGFTPSMCSFVVWSPPGGLIPVTLVYDPHNPGRCQIVFANSETQTGGGTLTVWAAGAKASESRQTIPGLSGGGTEGESIHLEAGIPPFPPGAKRAPLGPKEPNDPGFGDVYYDLPPEWFTQAGTHPIARNLDLIRGDAFTFETSWAPQDVNPTCDFTWLVSIGQNTNYSMRMWFTGLLVKYPDDVIDRFLTDYAVWYTHLLIGRYDQPMDEVQRLAQKARAHGLYVCYFTWDTGEMDWLAARGAVDVMVPGLEINKLPDYEVDRVVRHAAAVCVPVGIKVWPHFLSTGGPRNLQQWGIYDYVPWWREMYELGVTGLLYETWMTYEPDPAYTVEMGADPNHLGDSAGKMGGMAGYARRGLYQAHPRLKFCHCETWSAPPFDGHTDGLFASRRNFELVCCPSDGVMGPVAGYLNGARLPDGGVF